METPKAGHLERIVCLVILLPYGVAPALRFMGFLHLGTPESEMQTGPHVSEEASETTVHHR